MVEYKLSPEENPRGEKLSVTLEKIIPQLTDRQQLLFLADVWGKILYYVQQHISSLPSYYKVRLPQEAIDYYHSFRDAVVADKFADWMVLRQQKTAALERAIEEQLLLEPRTAVAWHGLISVHDKFHNLDRFQWSKVSATLTDLLRIHLHIVGQLAYPPKKLYKRGVTEEEKRKDFFAYSKNIFYRERKWQVDRAQWYLAGGAEASQKAAISRWSEEMEEDLFENPAKERYEIENLISQMTEDQALAFCVDIINRFPSFDEGGEQYYNGPVVVLRLFNIFEKAVEDGNVSLLSSDPEVISIRKEIETYFSILPPLSPIPSHFSYHTAAAILLKYIFSEERINRTVRLLSLRYLSLVYDRVPLYSPTGNKEEAWLLARARWNIDHLSTSQKQAISSWREEMEEDLFENPEAEDPAGMREDRWGIAHFIAHLLDVAAYQGKEYYHQLVSVYGEGECMITHTMFYDKEGKPVAVWVPDDTEYPLDHGLRQNPEPQSLWESAVEMAEGMGIPAYEGKAYYKQLVGRYGEPSLIYQGIACKKGRCGLWKHFRFFYLTGRPVAIWVPEKR